MKFHYGRSTFKNKERSQEQCYLLTNGLGGYSSMTLAQSLTRNDHGLFVACTHAPTKRMLLVSKVVETLFIDDKSYSLTSQQFVDYTKNQNGEAYLINYQQENYPCWTYMVHGVVLKKEIIMPHHENTIAIHYELIETSGKQVKLEISPAVQFCPKGATMEGKQIFKVQANKISANDISMYVHSSDAEYEIFEQIAYEQDVYYAYDARDGRSSVGAYGIPLKLTYTFAEQKEVDLIFSLKEEVASYATYKKQEDDRIHTLIKNVGIATSLTKALVKASDQFITKRDSTHTQTIVAGYPFFADWGRDTMYAIEGCCITTKRYEDAKEIFRTFVKYMKKGILPNMFPEQGEEPHYNTVDASLLFIQALYQYYKASHDETFIKDEMIQPIQEIIDAYRTGINTSIHMDEDGLIVAGGGLEQLTWMDIRYGEELPTPRHGKPVEVNAYWYNGLCVLIYFKKLVGADTSVYEELASLVKTNFMKKFWNEKNHCLNDVVSGNAYDEQIRCNQIWAVSTPFSPVPLKQAKEIVQTVFEKLYTPYGLRTLASDDPQFVPEYSGCLYKRDMSYHQGTVWPFPLGSYFRAYLKVHAYSEEAKQNIREKLSYFEDCLEEGCVGQIAEIYDGLDPTTSRGCFAQAWSVGEIVKICKEVMEPSDS